MASRSLVVLAGCVVAAHGAPAVADPAPPALTFNWDASGDASGMIAYSWDWYGDAPTYGKYTLPGSSESWTGWMYSAAASDAAWELSWNTVFNETPGGGAFVSTNVVITNNSLSTENFSSEMVMPLSQPILSPMMNGGIQGTVTDLTFDSATVYAPTGWQIYTPRIDGVNEAGGFLMTDPFSESAGFLSTSQVGPEAFGGQPPLAASRDAIENIGVLLSFDLTPGDSASFTAFFEIVPLPGPGGLAAFAIAGLALRRRRR